MRVNTDGRNPGAVVRYIVSRLENPDAPNLSAARRPVWRRAPMSLTASPSTEAPPSPSASRPGSQRICLFAKGAP